MLKHLPRESPRVRRPVVLWTVALLTGASCGQAGGAGPATAASDANALADTTNETVGAEDVVQDTHNAAPVDVVSECANKACNDGNPCTDDGCDPTTEKCSFLANTAPCDDGDACTTDDACKDGACAAGAQTSCDDGNNCTADSCDAEAAACIHAPVAEPCDDGNGCTVVDVCDNGACTAGKGKDCNDGNPCTDDTCAPADGGCKHTSKPGCVGALKPCEAPFDCAVGVCDVVAHVCVPCLESTDCGPGYNCAKQQCVVATPCASGADCKATQQVCDKDDGVCVDCVSADDCADQQACVENGCVTTVPCKSDKTCQVVCDKDQGVCVECVTAADCKAGNFCTAWNSCAPVVCSGQACVGAKVFECATDGSGYDGAKPCEDDNECTDEGCDPAKGCTTTLNSAACGGGDPCTIKGTCKEGVCAATEVKDCDDSNPCTADKCVPPGDCVHSPASGAACDDGDPCTVDPKCVAGKCAPGKILSCDDGNVCTVDECSLGKCKATPGPLGLACGEAGACVAFACNEGGACATVNKADNTVCGPLKCGKLCEDGKCRDATEADYDDGNPCTKVFCDQGVEIVVQKVTDLSINCEDGEACTGDDSCIMGKCMGQAKTCSDGVSCTVDVCDSKTGCVHAPNNAKCTGDDPCVNLTCDIKLGCGPAKDKPYNDGAACDDGDDCTPKTACDKQGQCVGNSTCKCASTADCLDSQGKQPDSCVPVFCHPATKTCVPDPAKAVTCPSGNSKCSVVGCDPKTGQCSASAIEEGKVCDDGDVCTSVSKCESGECVGKADKSCDDSNPCTVDSCDPLAGCQKTAGEGECDDGNPCTSKDGCTKGACKGIASNCNDGIDCTYDACNDKTGKCGHTAKNDLCNDGEACTTDACDSAKGCTHTATQGAKCDDGDPCTKGDICVASVCKPGATAACDDGDLCTQDNCAPTGACTHPPVESGKPCAGGSKMCQGGKCASVTPPKGMVWIPAQVFQMGCNAKVDSKCKDHEKPPHDVSLSSFYMDIKEVSAGAYKLCVLGTKCTPAQSGKPNATYNTAKSNHPINYVTWQQAKQFCTAQGSRLCTEAEWEYAARGGDGRRYPWGNQSPNCTLAVASNCTSGPLAAGSKAAGASPFGILDLAGNVREWTADWYGATFYGSAAGNTVLNPKGPSQGTTRVMRGGDYASTAAQLRTSDRAFITPTLSSASVGIRCCRSILK